MKEAYVVKKDSMGRIVAGVLALVILSACGGGARSSTTDQAGTQQSAVTAPPMSEGSPQAAPGTEMQPRAGTPAQPIPSGLDCPADEIVWVNTSKHVYHYASDMYYGRTKHGTYMCEKDAQREHDRAAGSKKKSGSTTMQGVGKHHRRAAESPTPEETY